MATAYRKACEADIDAGLEVLRAAKAVSTKAWVKHADYDSGKAYLYATLRGETGASAFMVGGFLVVLRPAVSWETGQLRLVEEVMLRVGPGGTLSDVIAFAEQMARRVEAKAVVFGTAFSDRDEILSAAYQRHGYREEARLLYKDIT